MEPPKQASLRILIADGDVAHLEAIADLVTALGHEVVAKETSLEELGAHTAAQRPDVALVLVEEGPTALDRIDEIVQEAVCPVIAVLRGEDPAFINQAARRGISAYVAADDPEEMQSSIDIVLRRFGEYRGLQDAFERRAVTERAKGILMERHGVDEHTAFLMLRDEARSTRRKLVELAEAVVSGHRLLTADRRPDRTPSGPEEPGD
ncbi:MAG TPA: ANTAR domain-containing protein [Actinomycetota bacterium]